MAVLMSSFTTTQVIHQLLRPPPLIYTALPCLFVRPLFTQSSPTSKLKSVTLRSLKSTSKSKLHSPLSPSYFRSYSLPTDSLSFPLDASLEEEEENDEIDVDFEDVLLGDDDEDEEDSDDSEEEEEEEEEEEVGLVEKVKSEEESLKAKKSGIKLPTLTVKEKKELASYAHGLGKKLKCQLVGKSGITTNVATSFSDTLEANELLKIKIHRTCPAEVDEVVQQLEEATGAVVVGKIGRTVIIYRPSATKLKTEEKKLQARSRIHARKQARRPIQSKVRVPTFSKRGRQRRARV